MFIVTTYDMPGGKLGVHEVGEVTQKSTFDRIVESVEASATRKAAYLLNDDSKIIDAYFRSSPVRG